jgi:hypothetical protein
MGLVVLEKPVSWLGWGRSGVGAAFASRGQTGWKTAETGGALAFDGQRQPVSLITSS